MATQELTKALHVYGSFLAAGGPWFCNTLLPQVATLGVDLVQVLVHNLWRKTSMGSQGISPVSKRKAWEWLQVLFYVAGSLDKAMGLWFWTFEYVMPCQLTRFIFSPTKICQLLWNKLGRTETFSNLSSILLDQRDFIPFTVPQASVLSHAFAD